MNTMCKEKGKRKRESCRENDHPVDTDDYEVPFVVR
jgi:hypothetical protein